MGVIERLDDIFVGIQQRSNAVHAVHAVNESRRVDLDELDRYIDGDIADRLAAAKGGASAALAWRRLDACLKWRTVCAYLAQAGVEEGSSEHAAAREAVRAGNGDSEVEAKAQAWWRGAVAVGRKLSKD